MNLPEKLKKGLKVCRKQYDGMHWISCHLECPYKAEGVWCEGILHKDAIDYINQLESRLAQVERERDALIRLYVPHNCISCKHGEKRYECTIPCKWEWRGVCPENTEE